MKICSWNVNGIRSVEKKGALEAFFNDVDPDILCIQETKAQPDQVADDMAAAYPQYHQFWHSAERRGYSGTAIFSKIAPLNVFYGLRGQVKPEKITDEYGNAGEEGRVITAEYLDWFVTGVYTPNAKDNLGRLAVRTEWDQAFLAHLQVLEQTKPVIAVGDLNVAHEPIDLARPKPNRGKKGFTDEERSGFSNFVEAGYVDSYRTQYPTVHGAYTWWSHYAKARERNVGWRIDYVLISQGLSGREYKATIHNTVKGSDHCPVSVTFKL